MAEFLIRWVLRSGITYEELHFIKGNYHSLSLSMTLSGHGEFAEGCQTAFLQAKNLDAK